MRAINFDNTGINLRANKLLEGSTVVLTAAAVPAALDYSNDGTTWLPLVTITAAAPFATIVLKGSYIRNSAAAAATLLTN